MSAVRIIRRLSDLLDVEWNGIQDGDVLIRDGNTVTGAVVVGDARYRHEQLNAAPTWTVVHNLGKHPAIHVEDSGGTVVFGEVHHDSDAQATLTFSAPFGGTALCN